MSLAYDRSDDRAAPERVVAVTRAGVLTRDICRRGGGAEVAAVFDRSFYVRAGDDFICIGEPAIGNGPLTLIVAAPLSQLDLRRGQAASVDERQIVIGGVRFDLRRCETWRPPPWPAATVRPGTMGVALIRRAAAASPPDSLARAIVDAADSPLARIARPRVARFEEWLSEQTQVSSCPETQNRHPEVRPRPSAGGASKDERPPVARSGPSPFETLGASRQAPQGDGSNSLDAIRGLIGLGPGLTPSGDDFLMGALTVLDALGQTKMHAALGHAVAAAAPALTSPVSACFLRAAAAGHVGERLHDMVAAALSGDVEAAVAAARRIGHTSGWDALAGVATTLQATMT
jgi:hypothetical protein